MKTANEDMAARQPESAKQRELRSVVRWSALLAALADGSLDRPALIARLGAAYPPEPSARPMIDRDIARLAQIGIHIVRSQTRPPVYTLLGGTPDYTAEQLRTLAVIRDTFGARHPQAVPIAALLDQLTAGLSDAQRVPYRLY